MPPERFVPEAFFEIINLKSKNPFYYLFKLRDSRKNYERLTND